MAWACLAASGTGSLLCTDGVTADRSHRLNAEVYRPILSTHIQPDVIQLIRWCFILQNDNDSRSTAKANQEFFKACFFFLVLEDKTEISESHKQTATEGGYNKGLAEHIKVDDTAFGDVSDF